MATATVVAASSSAAALDTEEISRLLANSDAPDANFADRFVGDETVRQISDALANDSSKSRVFLDRNCIGADGAAALGGMLKVWLKTAFLVCPLRVKNAE